MCIVTLCHGSQCKLMFKDCGSKAGSLSGALYNGTCAQGKAILVQGTVVSIAFNFQTKNSEATLKSVVHGKIGELPFVPFPLGNPDACKDSGLSCPVAPNTSVNYQPVLNILSSYPKVNVIVKWELQNKDGTDVFCALIPASITAP
ncbi:epididymal secretory protein e1 [Plakobranchus ocellatus]|uniref:Epididymal secretory protein e1 n=1 Tax=Plakobranchus ocellatus TaxID=259542 RepID=A0AAV4B5M0_9GAST|nr:epididymal secretory protein e1 [Plakobranchus ocellatus]